MKWAVLRKEIMMIGSKRWFLDSRASPGSFQPFIVKAYLSRQAGGRQGVRLVSFAPELQILDPENPERQHPEAEVEN